MQTMRWALGICVVLACVHVSREVDAQVDLSGGLPLQQFQPLPGGDRNFTHVSGHRVGRHLAWTAGLYLNYGFQPLVLREDGLENREVELVRNQVGGDILASLSLWDRLELGVAIPVALYQDSGPFQGLPERALDTIALGDVRLVPRVALFETSFHLGMAFATIINLPTGNAEAMGGNDSVTVEPRVILGWGEDRGLRIGAHLGALFRAERRLANIDLGHELTFGAGYQQPILPERLALMLEFFGRTGLGNAGEVNLEEVPLEALLSARWWPAREHALTGGVGMGLTPGYGVPVFRVVLGYTLTQRAIPDTDGDGLLDPDDQCPLEPEDFDGFQDEDGCPDPDNDGDGIPDVLDQCPNEPEDLDGFQDEDGCPGPDNDGDGIPDVRDQCPNEPEDFDGFQDEDGCPDPDNDGDGIPDVDDQCPNDPEDLDGFEDEDGCPDPDNDQDGILDVDDLCPNEPEVYNGIDDHDGCPDEGEMRVRVTAERIEILERVYFDTNSSRIQERSHSILLQVAGVLRSNPQISQIEVQGHTDDQGPEDYNDTLSQQRAESVVTFLVEQGNVARQRLVAVGYGERVPLIPGTSRRARDANRRVDFVLIQQTGETNVPVRIDDAPPAE